MWSGPKTRGLHHTVPLQTLDHFFNKWYDLSDFSDPGANQSKLLQHVFLLHYIGEHVSVDSGADSTGKTFKLSVSVVYLSIALFIVHVHFVASAQCGQSKMEPCQLPAGLAQVVSTEDGTFKVENMSEACPNSWPWHVSLQSHDTHYCSGVLVHPRWVLAPRHCFAK